MPMVCSVCRLDARAEVDAELIECRATLRDIARRHGVSKDAVARHRAACIAESLTAGTKAVQVSRADDLLERVTTLEEDARRIQGAAEAAGERRVALAAIRERTRLVELMAELQGKLQSGPRSVTNIAVVLSDAERLHRRRLLMRVLNPPAEEPGDATEAG
jgi:hypothetical protein